MRIEFTADEVSRLAENTLPWFADTTRNIMGKTPLVAPEYDEARGVFYYDSDAVDEIDEWFVRVLRAGWAYVDSDPSFAGLEAVQAALDWQEWEQLYTAVTTGQVTQADAIAAATTYLVTISSTIGVPVPKVLGG